MNRLGAGVARRGQDPLDVEIRARRRRLADPDRAVGGRDVQRMAVGIGIDRHRLHAETAQRADDAARYRAAIGDQHSFEHLAAARPQSQTIISTGVGLYALHGLLSCGQFETSTSTSVSARISTYLPASLMPSSKLKPPSGVSGTFMKKLMLLARSR